MVETSTNSNCTFHTFGPEEIGGYRRRMILWQWVLVVEGKLKATQISLSFKY